jgi:hypothetical protein
MPFWCHRFDQKSNENIVKISVKKVLKLPWGFLDPFWGFLINDITTKSPGSHPEATKNFRAEILTIFLLLFWSK